MSAGYPSTPQKLLEMKRPLVISILMLAGLTAAPALVLAQADPVATTDAQDTTATTDRSSIAEQNDESNWG